MPADLPPFPAIELLLMDLLDDLGTVDTATPDDLEQQLPFIQVNRIGGTDNVVTDTTRVVVSAYASDWPTGNTLAETIRQRLISGPHVLSGGVLDQVRTVVSPQELPHSIAGSRSATKGHANVRRFGATYSAVTRRPS